MAEPLKNGFGTNIPRQIAAMLAAVAPDFPAQRFVRTTLVNYESLSLKQRAQQIADALAQHLSAPYPKAIKVLIASLGPKLGQSSDNGMTPFLYFPHTLYVAEHGLGHFEESMQAQYELTQRFTAEFSIRPYLMQHPAATLKRLAEWARDPDVHVRRLVSEGTRPRLPWASRLPAFQRDPTPVLQLLDLLKDDPELYVRRSVANNLNDIGKDHPAQLATTARQWLQDATPARRWVVQHALRSAVKRGEAAALSVLGFGEAATVTVDQVRITPKHALHGGKVSIGFTVTNNIRRKQTVLVDFRIHFVKASGKYSPKVFKLKVLNLAPLESVHLQKSVSLADLATRKHHPGVHQVDALLNGQPQVLGEFTLRR